MVTTMSQTSSLTLCSSIHHTSTLNPPFRLKFPNHHHYTRTFPHFSISSSEHKFNCQLSIPVIVAKCANDNGAQEDEDDDDEEEEEEEYSVGVKAALSVLKFYKREISPLLPRSCRYVPTCSEYSMIAYKKYGFVKGSALTTWRLCRCNPLGGTGFDPPRWFGEEGPLEDID